MADTPTNSPIVSEEEPREATLIFYEQGDGRMGCFTRRTTTSPISLRPIRSSSAIWIFWRTPTTSFAERR